LKGGPRQNRRPRAQKPCLQGHFQGSERPFSAALCPKVCPHVAVHTY
jgi:hypothetical protein